MFGKILLATLLLLIIFSSSTLALTPNKETQSTKEQCEQNIPSYLNYLLMHKNTAKNYCLINTGENNGY